MWRRGIHCKASTSAEPETTHFHALITCLGFGLSSSISLPHVLFDCLCFMLPLPDSSFLYLNYLLWFEYKVPESPPVSPRLCDPPRSRPKSGTRKISLAISTFSFSLGCWHPPPSYLICPLLFATRFSPTHFRARTP